MKIFAAFSALLFFCASLFAQQQYTFTNYTQEQGLLSGSILNMYKDTTGYIWIFSEDGVSRFDGYNFRKFRHNPDDSTSLPKDFFWSGAFTKFGDIYFGSQGGFRKFNPASGSFTSHLPCGDSVKILYVDEANGVTDCYWIRSKFSIFRISKNGSERFALPHAITYQWRMVASPGNGAVLYNEFLKDSLLFFDYRLKTVSKIKMLDRWGMEDSSSIMDVIFTGNNFYLFTPKSLYRFDSTAKSFTWQLDLKRPENFETQTFRSFAFNDSLVIILSKKGYLNIFNIRTGEQKLVYVNKKIPESELTDRFILAGEAKDNAGGVWLGTNQMGLIHYNLFTGELEQYIHEPGNINSLPNNFVYHVLSDENGVIWLGCMGYGLVKMEPVTPIFKTAIPAARKKTGSAARGAWSTNIRGFVETDDGYWIATLSGLFSYSNQTGQFDNLTHLFPVSDRHNNAINANTLIEYPFGSLAKDHSGNLWIGTWYGELVVYDTKLKRAFPFRRPQPLKDHGNNEWFRNLFCDSKNRMWISTQSAGICMVDCNALNFENINETKFEYNFSDEKDSTSVTGGIAFVVMEDADHNIWAGTENGLCKYNEQKKNWKRYYNIPGDSHSIHLNNVRSMCLDKQGNLWIGTNGGGLNRYNKEQDNFTHFTTENGLPDDQIYSLVCDDNGMLWMGTNHGLCRFNPSDYSCKNFTEEDGIQNYEYNTGAAIKLKDGTLLIGGVAGYNIIDPNKIENKKSIPPVVISSFKIFDKETPTGDGHLNLNYEENSFTFEFAALSYYRNQENHYAYKLEGIDRDWIYCDTRRNVTYSQLKPGNYIFKVKACNHDGVWNESGAQLQIIIDRPWWQQAWFILFSLTFVIGVIYFISKREKNRAKQLEAVRARISRDLHDDIGSTLQSISVMSEIVRRKSKSVVPELIQPIEKIGNTSREMIEKMNDIVWAVNPQNDHFENILLHMRSFAGELLAGKDIALHFKAEDGLKVKLPMEKRKSFFLVYKEAINNAYKYSGAKNVTVEISKTNHNLKLVVEDDGCGFNMNGDGLKISGNGLKNMRTRADELNGNFSITSETGHGTKVSLTINLN